jgi:Flp pilus assembly protein TadG
MIVVICTVLFTVFEICELMYAYTVMADAAQEGARFAVVHQGVLVDDPSVIAHVQRFANMSMHDVSAMTVTVELPDTTNAPPHRVRVKVAYSYVPYLHTLMPNPPSIHTYAEGRMIVQ